MAEEKNEVLQKARIEMNYLTGDAAVRRLAELREKWEMDRISEISNAKAEGIKQNKTETAKEMLKQGLPIEMIISITKLTKEEIEKLK